MGPERESAAGSERQIRIPLGELCREALVQTAEAPVHVLAQLFDERYGEDGQAYFDLCVAQYELSGDPGAWDGVVDGRMVVVVHIHDGALPMPDIDAATAPQTFVVEDDDVSFLPPEVKPLVEQEIHRRATGELRAAPYVPLFDRQERRQAMQAGTVVLMLLLAAMVYFVGGLLGLWPFPFAGISSGTATSPKP